MDTKATLADRVVYGLLVSVSITFTTLALPIVLAALTKMSIIMGYLHYYSLQQLTIIAALSFIVGFGLGHSSLTLMGHFWFTEKPRNILLSVFLWLLIFVISYYAYLAK